MWKFLDGLGYSFTLGVTAGFEFVDKACFGGGWVLHCFFFKLIYFNVEQFNDHQL